MKKPLRIIRALAVIGIVAALGYDAVNHTTAATHRVSNSVPAYQIGQVIPDAQRKPAPDLSGTTLTGTRLDTAVWNGHVVVVNFWGSWCAPCRREAAGLARTANDTKPLGAQFVGVDILDNTAAGLAFEHEFGIPYPSFDDPNNALGVRFSSLVPTATPETFVFDTRGRIAAVFIGATTYASLDPVVRLVVAGKG